MFLDVFLFLFILLFVFSEHCMLNYVGLFGLFLELLYIRSPFFPENFFLVCLFFLYVFFCFF